MWQNFLITAIRNLLRNKAFSILNIGGLALGIVVLILTFTLINNENAFDKFNKKGDRIFRLNEVHNFKGSREEKDPLSIYPMATALEKDYPEIESTVRISDNDDITLKANEKQLLSKEI